MLFCTDDACKNVNCGKGSCKVSSDSVSGFECHCSHGWKKIFPLPFSPCTVHNCEYAKLISKSYLLDLGIS